MQLFIMCGISGIYSFTDTAESFVPCVEKSIQTLRNRGPEVQRVECKGRVVLAHARLAILDKVPQETNRLPMPRGDIL